MCPEKLRALVDEAHQIAGEGASLGRLADHVGARKNFFKIFQYGAGLSDVNAGRHLQYRHRAGGISPQMAPCPVFTAHEIERGSFDIGDALLGHINDDASWIYAPGQFVEFHRASACGIRWMPCFFISRLTCAARSASVVSPNRRTSSASASRRTCSINPDIA